MSDPSRRLNLPLSGEQPVPPSASVPPADPDASLEERVVNALRTVYDPEIPINVVDLGLIYDLQINPLPGGGNKVLVQMTLTAQGKVKLHTAVYSLDAALDAIHDLDSGKLRGRGILVP